MTNSAPRVRPGILDIEPYVAGESKVASGIKPIKLSSNETPLGPSQSALQAYQEAAAQLERYPDGQATPLRTAIAKRFGLNADRIVCGAGSDELLNLLAHAYLGPGDEGIYTEHGFLVYRIAILSRGATPVVVPEKDLRTDVDAILAAVTPRTRIVFVANPNNPTGTYIPIDEVRRLRANLRSDILLVLDAAYAEYVTRNDYESGFELVATNDNTVMTRTFSKIYGLAALRIGWCYCPSGIADVLNRIRGPFNLSAPAIAAGAAAIADIESETKAREHNDRYLQYVTQKVEEMGLCVTPSVANFILIHFPKDQNLSADAADAYLRSKGILLRKVAGYGLPNSLRMTIGSDDDNEAVLTALRSFMAGATA